MVCSGALFLPGVGKIWPQTFMLVIACFRVWDLFPLGKNWKDIEEELTVKSIVQDGVSCGYRLEAWRLAVRKGGLLASEPQTGGVSRFLYTPIIWRNFKDSRVGCRMQSRCSTPFRELLPQSRSPVWCPLLQAGSPQLSFAYFHDVPCDLRREESIQ
jgi:hypothetical protein